jgi:hypothetical protein
MIRAWQLSALLFLAMAATVGCGPTGVREVKVEGKNPPALEQAKVILQRYADGAPVSSEASDFPRLVEEVRKTDPEKADVLEKGFAYLRQTKGSPAPVAREMLKRL